MRITPSCLRAADAGKHIIMEKPLTGYFGMAGGYFTEKLETKAGWNRPSCDEDWFRGFAQETEDFVEAIRDGREPRSGIDLAVECVNVINAAYQSAETGYRVTLT